MTKDIDFTLPYRVYDLNGRIISDKVDLLKDGIYIIRQGSKVLKYHK